MQDLVVVVHIFVILLQLLISRVYKMICLSRVLYVFGFITHRINLTYFIKSNLFGLNV